LIANALSAGFHRIINRALPAPVRFRDRVTRYRHFIAACSAVEENIVGTAGQGKTSKPEAGTGGPVAGPGQLLHEIEVPKKLHSVEDVAELHRKLLDHLRNKG
jgi:hypothetical protein